MHLAYVACDLTSISSLVQYDHAAAGYPVKETQCKAIANGNCATWPGLTAEAVRKYYPVTDETILRTMSQKRKNVRSTSTKLNHNNLPQAAENNIDIQEKTKSKEVQVFLDTPVNFTLTKQESSRM